MLLPRKSCSFAMRDFREKERSKDRGLPPYGGTILGLQVRSSGNPTLVARGLFLRAEARKVVDTFFASVNRGGGKRGIGVG